MHSLLMTFGFGMIGVLCIAFSLLYGQDRYPGLTWYQVLQQDLAFRITFLVVGVAFLVYSGLLQFYY